MKLKLFISGLLITLVLQGYFSFATQRFPKPEFETSYSQPNTLQPQPRHEFLAFMDVLVLLGSLALISWLVIKKRSRKGVFWMSLFSLAYFGFYREGCVCAIGSVQNVSLALFHHSYYIPLTVLAFFLLPLVFTLFSGRTFCAGVCPFGALQDLVAFRPQKLGTRLNAVLGMLPYVYLGLAVLYATTGTDFIICRYDPFVGFFRFNAPFGMFVFAAILLACGIFLARPYCRFLCPYGVLLSWVSRYSMKHLNITPSHCIQCRLCEDSCPYDAIDFPLTIRNPEGKDSRLRKLIIISILIPMLMLSCGYLGSRINERLASVNNKVRLAKDILNPAKMAEIPESYEIKAYKSSGKPSSQIFSEASGILQEFYIGGWILGGFLGLVFGIRIANRMVTRFNPDYITNKTNCLSCSRCVDYCPIKS